MFVASGVEEVEEAVELEVEFPEMVDVGLPERMICESVLVVVAVPEEFPAALKEAKANMVVDPNVVVRVVDPEVTVLTMAAVLIAEELRIVELDTV